MDRALAIESVHLRGDQSELLVGEGRPVDRLTGHDGIARSRHLDQVYAVLHLDADLLDDLGGAPHQDAGLTLGEGH